MIFWSIIFLWEKYSANSNYLSKKQRENKNITILLVILYMNSPEEDSDLWLNVPLWFHN